MRYFKVALRRAICFLKPYLPRNRWGDWIFCLIDFVVIHRRLPSRKSGLFNDRLFFMKVDGSLSQPLRVQVTDKEFLKDYVSETIGNVYNVPTFAVLRSDDEAQSFQYPHRCVIKPTHLSGRIILRRNGETIDKREISAWFKLNYYHTWRETNYKTLVPKVIVEPILYDDENAEDFKIFCVDGVPKLIEVDSDRRTFHKRSLYLPDWTKQDYGLLYPQGPSRPCPKNLSQMLAVAAKLSAAFDFIRVDLYSNGSQIYVGELTSCHGSAIERFIPPSAEREASRALFAV
jgi:hypothetical protein